VAPDLVRRCRSLVSVWPAPYCAEADDIRRVCSRRESFLEDSRRRRRVRGRDHHASAEVEPAQKSALLDEVEAENGKVAVVARRHGISESLLYNWRSAWKAAACVESASETVDFVPLGIVGEQAGRDGRCWRPRNRIDSHWPRSAMAELERVSTYEKRLPAYKLVTSLLIFPARLESYEGIWVTS
jgi:transposase-like protein